MRKEKYNWSIPVNDIIHVPDELDKIVNKIAFQFRFHTMSGKNEAMAVCDSVALAQEFFEEKFSKVKVLLDSEDRFLNLYPADKPNIDIVNEFIEKELYGKLNAIEYFIEGSFSITELDESGTKYFVNISGDNGIYTLKIMLDTIKE